MPGKFENGQTNSDRRHKQHGNNHLADKKIGTHESKKKHAPVGDDDAKYYYSKSQKGFGPPMKKAAVSNYKKPESKFGRSPNKHDQNADCTYAIEQTDTNAGHLNKNQIMRSEHGQSDAQHGREKNSPFVSPR